MIRIAIFVAVWLASVSAFEASGYADALGHHLAYCLFWVTGLGLQAVVFWLVGRDED